MDPDFDTRAYAKPVVDWIHYINRRCASLILFILVISGFIQYASKDLDQPHEQNQNRRDSYWKVAVCVCRGLGLFGILVLIVVSPVIYNLPWLIQYSVVWYWTEERKSKSAITIQQCHARWDLARCDRCRKRKSQFDDLAKCTRTIAMYNQLIRALKRRKGENPEPGDLDLHYLPVREAEDHVLDILVEYKDDHGYKLGIITGKGNRSRDNKPKIKPVVMNMLEDKGYTFEYDKTPNGRPN